MAMAAEQLTEPVLVLDKPFYSPTEVGQMARVSNATILNWIKAGRLVAVRLSERTYRIPRKSVMRLLGMETVAPVIISEPDADVE